MCLISILSRCGKRKSKSRAFLNYFADTRVFIGAVNQAVDFGGDSIGAKHVFTQRSSRAAGTARCTPPQPFSTTRSARTMGSACEAVSKLALERVTPRGS